MRSDLIAMVDHARSAADSWRERLYERRDRAVLLIGWFGALTRPQIVGLSEGQVRQLSAGQWVIGGVVDRSGTRDVELPKGHRPNICPRCAYVRWMDVLANYDKDSRLGLIRVLGRPEAEHTHACTSYAASSMGSPMPVFRLIKTNQAIAPHAMSAHTVHEIIVRRATAIGLDGRRFGARSLRAGNIAEAQSRHGEDPRDR